ncbi:MAG: LPS assembly lipoprotein LptE, partial [Saprospiraceae bacterium]
ETRLKFKDIDPDIEFSGAITGYAVTAEAPQEGETTSFSRLTIYIEVEYIDHKGTDTEPKKQKFNFFEDFPTNQNLLSIQDDLIDDIFDDLTEKVFNWAFNNW